MRVRILACWLDGQTVAVADAAEAAPLSLDLGRRRFALGDSLADDGGN